jgi:hypothetical protein
MAAPAPLPSPASVRALYRSLLRHVSVFPSIKRAELLAEVRAEVRERAFGLDRSRAADAPAIAAAVAAGERGLATLRKYTSLDAAAPHWRVDLEQDPLGEAAAQQRRAQALSDAARAARALR